MTINITTTTTSSTVVTKIMGGKLMEVVTTWVVITEAWVSLPDSEDSDEMSEHSQKWEMEARAELARLKEEYGEPTSEWEWYASAGMVWNDKYEETTIVEVEPKPPKQYRPGHKLRAVA